VIAGTEVEHREFAGTNVDRVHASAYLIEIATAEPRRDGCALPGEQCDVSSRKRRIER